MEKIKKILKPKIIIIIIAIISIITIVVISNSKSKPISYLDDGQLVLTKEMIKDIKETVIDTNDNTKLSYKWNSEMIRMANSRAGNPNYTYGYTTSVTPDCEGVKEFTKCKVTSMEQKDAYNYNIYGTIYGTDKFDRPITKQFSWRFYCKTVDFDTEKGYIIESGGFKLSENNQKY